MKYTVEDVHRTAVFLYDKNVNLRYGQALIQALGAYDRNLVLAITGTESDPFYADSPRDTAVRNFWSRVVEGA